MHCATLLDMRRSNTHEHKNCFTFKTLDISQNSDCSVDTHLRCCGIFSDSITIDFLLILTVK